MMVALSNPRDARMSVAFIALARTNVEVCAPLLQLLAAFGAFNGRGQRLLPAPLPWLAEVNQRPDGFVRHGLSAAKSSSSASATFCALKFCEEKGMSAAFGAAPVMGEPLTVRLVLASISSATNFMRWFSVFVPVTAMCSAPDKEGRDRSPPPWPLPSTTTYHTVMTACPAVPSPVAASL